ncbi:uncharacterized protein LOC135388281 [Ornithodoros turicata]|uniref:uncharacterized protein LOC135388281 n=1 Tax=Ornithodoros turicata TaxID=34597 RepID=UPI003139A078
MSGHLRGGTSLDYAVVHFLAENSIEIVPRTWVSKDRKSVLWPAYGRMRMKRAIEKHERPENTWKTFSCRVVFTGDYQSALKQAEEAEYMTDLHGDDESDASCSLAQPMSSQACGTPNIAASQSGNGSMRSEISVPISIPASESTDDSEAYCTSSAYTSGKKRHASEDEHGSSPRKLDPNKVNRRMFRRLLEKMEALSDDTKKLGRETRQIRSMLQQHMQPDDVSNVESFDVLPVKDELGLHAIERSLTDETNFRGFVCQLWTSGGSSSAECTRNILKRLMSLEFAAGLCYSGHNANKRVFKELLMSRLLTACVRRAFPSTTDKEIAAAARNYFRCAPGVVRRRRSHTDFDNAED